MIEKIKWSAGRRCGYGECHIWHGQTSINDVFWKQNEVIDAVNRLEHILKIKGDKITDIQP